MLIHDKIYLSDESGLQLFNDVFLRILVLRKSHNVRLLLDNPPGTAGLNTQVVPVHLNTEKT